MQIKVETKTGAVSVKLTQQEKRCLKTAQGICDAIGRNVPEPRYAQEAEQALACVLEELVDQAVVEKPVEEVEPTMDFEQSGILQAPVKKKGRRPSAEADTHSNF